MVVAIITNICITTKITKLKPIPDTKVIIKERITDKIKLPTTKFLNPTLSQLSDVLPSLLQFL